jgi:hypothetical protein
MKNKLELLAPAGDVERLKMSVLYGADAVYLAGNAFGFRGEISLYVGDGNDTHKKLSIGGSADYTDKRYELQMRSGELALKISAL